jgi:hypothetical protein
MRLAVYVAHMGEIRSAYILCFVGETECKRPIGRPRLRWEDNLKWILGK